MIATGLALAILSVSPVSSSLGPAWPSNTASPSCQHAGLIDSATEMSSKVIVLNTDPDSDYVVERGDHIAQLVIQRSGNLSPVVVDSLSK